MTLTFQQKCGLSPPEAISGNLGSRSKKEPEFGIRA